jgi:hypothetical protein
MDERDQLLEGALVAVSPLEQESGDLRVVMSNLGILGPFDSHRGLTKPRWAHKILGAMHRRTLLAIGLCLYLLGCAWASLDAQRAWPCSVERRELTVCPVRDRAAQKSWASARGR